MINLRFSNELSKSQLGDVMKVLSRPRLWIPTSADYPRHQEWLDKSEAQIAEGSKRALLAYADNTPVGAIVYRRHETEEKTVEIRNISIDPAIRGQLFGAFMLRQVETDVLANEYPKADTFVVDTKINNTSMISFLENQGYRRSNTLDLYQDGTGMDAILVKTLTL